MLATKVKVINYHVKKFIIILNLYLIQLLKIFNSSRQSVSQDEYHWKKYAIDDEWKAGKHTITNIQPEWH